jgi:CTP:molybdopterin cytidylyltransferase MocA
MNAAPAHAVVLAAGCASRYGSPKQCLPIDGVPMVRRAALLALRAGLEVSVVTGAHRASVEACLADANVELVFNPAWERGMGTSIASGVRHLLRTHPHASACLLVPADLPRLTAADLVRLLPAKRQRQHPHDIIAAAYQSTIGAPCLFPRRYFDELMELDDSRGARVVLSRHRADVHAVPMAHAAFDIDTPEDYGRYEQARREVADGVLHDEPSHRCGSERS